MVTLVLDLLVVINATNSLVELKRWQFGAMEQVYETVISLLLYALLHKLQQKYKTST